MRTSVLNLLEDAKGRLSAYAALLNYRFANLSIKAAPEALLSIEVQIDGEILPIEKAVMARNAEGREDQFELFPMYSSMLFPVLKGLNETHPEYKIEIKQLGESDDEEERYILATMPEVDDVRHEVLTDAVGLLCDGCKARMDATLSYYNGQLALKLAGADPQELDEAKNQLQELYDTADNLCKQYRENKEKEIEEAYQLYLAKKEEKKAELLQSEELQKAQQAGQQMTWNPQDE